MTKRSATEARKKRVTLRDDCVRPERLANAIMDAAPVNEMGVMCLFTEWARKRNMRIETIRAEFPDCIAWQRGVAWSSHHATACPPRRLSEA
jgi:hypothetical protein